MANNSTKDISEVLAKGLLVDIKAHAYNEIMDKLIQDFSEKASVVVEKALEKVTEERVEVAMDLYSGGEYKIHVEFKHESPN